MSDAAPSHHGANMSCLPEHIVSLDPKEYEVQPDRAGPRMRVDDMTEAEAKAYVCHLIDVLLATPNTEYDEPT